MSEFMEIIPRPIEQQGVAARSTWETARMRSRRSFRSPAQSCSTLGQGIVNQFERSSSRHWQTSLQKRKHRMDSFRACLPKPAGVAPEPEYRDCIRMLHIVPVLPRPRLRNRQCSYGSRRRPGRGAACVQNCSHLFNDGVVRSAAKVVRQESLCPKRRS